MCTHVHVCVSLFPGINIVVCSTIFTQNLHTHMHIHTHTRTHTCTHTHTHTLSRPQDTTEDKEEEERGDNKDDRETDKRDSESSEDEDAGTSEKRVKYFQEKTLPSSSGTVTTGSFKGFGFKKRVGGGAQKRPQIRQRTSEL